MGSVLGFKVLKNGGMKYKIVLDYAEALQLKGHRRNIHVFSQETITNLMAQKRANYLRIPRTEIIQSKQAVCQRIETKEKAIFVFAIDIC